MKAGHRLPQLLSLASILGNDNVLYHPQIWTLGKESSVIENALSAARRGSYPTIPFPEPLLN
jgi:hypothetical protein